ncbi:MAG: serine hydrolase [Balneolaceae bacterium]
MKYKLLILFSLLFLLLGFFGVNGQPSDRSDMDEILGLGMEVGSIKSIMIEKNGELIAEKYRGRMNASRSTNIKSASKSIISLLIGIAIDKGYIESVDETIDQYFEEYFSANPDSIKEALTIQDLLTMRTGLESTSMRNYGRWVISDNWSEFTLNRPMVGEPGGNMIYSTGTSHLLSIILTKATGMDSRQFANEYLFGPMDIRLGGWDRDPQGYFMGGNNMALSPEALLKIGRMMMDLGEYNGQRIVSAEWILDSVKVYGRSNYNPYDYGYMWWRQDVGEYEVVFAWGNSGQYIMMLPELDSVISITSSVGQNNGSRRYQRDIFNYVENSLIPFIENSEPAI